MNIVQSDTSAFIFPDDMDDFRKRYNADVIFIDFDQDAIYVFGPKDYNWRELPGDDPNGAKVVSLRKDFNG